MSKITLKKSSIPGKAPSVSDIDYGELAINYADGKLYFKTSSNTIDTFVSSTTAGTQNTFVDIAVPGQTTITAENPTDTLTISSGLGLSITTDPVSNTLTIGNTGVTSLAGLSGDISATEATNAILPDQSNNQNKVLATDGTNTYWSYMQASFSFIDLGLISDTTIVGSQDMGTL